MTCVIAIKDVENNCILMGADSCVSSGMRERIMSNQKIFVLNNTENALIGMSGTLRDINLMKYSFAVNKNDFEAEIGTGYIVNDMIPIIKATLDLGGSEVTAQGIDAFQSNIILAHKEEMWLIYNDYSVSQYTDADFLATGSGSSYAIGALEAMYDFDLPAKDKLLIALEASAKYATGVAPPFYLYNTKNKDIEVWLSSTEKLEFVEVEEDEHLNDEKVKLIEEK